ncbi:hypothetical protein ACMHYB_05105 [Sorangium sp. So ce1128]
MPTSARTSSSEKRERMRAIQAPSRSVIRLKAGFGYSFFHPSGSKCSTS